MITRKPYYEKNRFKLYHVNTLDFLKEIPENSIDMIFADPPYFLSSGTFTCQNGKMVSVKKGDWDLSSGTKNNFEFHVKWLKVCRRALKPNGTIWISGTYHSIYQCGFALEINKFHLLNDIAWFKPNASPNLSCRFFTASHETLLWARKEKKAKHIFNYKTMVDWKNNYGKEIKCKHCGKNGRYEVLHEKGKQMRSVWTINTPQKIEKTFGKHPTQKPIELLKRIVLASTNKDDLILDPFTGSSTTGLAAYLLGRKFIGIDTEKEYLDLSIKRFEELDKNLKRKFPKK
jgi:site-specific DNA-methyltransferase (adenine-specific)